jgi:hypothetical protein
MSKQERQELKNLIASRSDEFIQRLVNDNKWINDMNLVIEQLANVDTFKDKYNLATKLAMYQINLGELVSKLVRKTNAAYAYRKYSYSCEWIGSVKSGKSRDNDAEIAVMEDRVNEIALKYVSDVMKSKHDDVKSLIMLIQTGAKLIESERSQSGM